ncbi:MAG: hypothetical protein ACNA8L_01205 [Luteolibacter sp.]
MNRTSRNAKNGFALPMTIIAIGGLALLLIGLVAVLTLERKTARSYSDATRAELAVESGLAVAIGKLMDVAGRDDSLVFRIDDPVEPTVITDDRPLGFREQFFTYGAVFQDGEWRGIPLFSGKPPVDLGSGQLDTGILQSLLTSYTADAETLGRMTEHDQNIPRAKWVIVPPGDPDGYTMRYAFWIEDLGGRIPGKTAASTDRRDGMHSAEIDYATILNPESEEPTLPPALIAARDSLRTSASVRPILTDGQDMRIEPYIHFYETVPPGEIRPPKLIPQGFGYPEAGTPAADLNEFVARADVDGIASHIARQLPNFDARKGGFPATEDYLKTLAASMIDYADEDNDATSGPGYRGIDAYPFVNELFDRYEWVAGAADEVAIQIGTYVELWNPTQQTISGNIQFTNVNRHIIRIPLVGDRQFSEIEFPEITVTIPPNGFRVIPLGERIQTFPQGAFPPTELLFPMTYDSNYLLSWNGTLVDTARGGLQRTDGNLRAGSAADRRRWKGNGSPAHDWSIGQAGDPRASWYIDTWVFANSYDNNSNWGGRALKRGIAANRPFREVRLETWADRGSNSAPGVDPGTDARVPTESRIILKSTGAPIAGKEYPPNEPNMAPARISNAGEYFSLAELGHIFDPAQWSSVESPSGVPSSSAGGGFTLAIGRPEFAAFDRDGLRAAQLLDIFTLATAEPGFPRVNINTAPREVLRAIIGGVALEADPMAPDVELRKNETLGDIFADFVIAHRNESPLRSLSDLNNLRTQPLLARDHTNREDAPFFGNIKYFDNAPEVVNPSLDMIEWNDAGREELFRKVMNLVAFDSKSFRIVVAGEALDRSGRTIGKAMREYHCTIEPERDASGLVIPGGRPRVILHYENTL